MIQIPYASFCFILGAAEENICDFLKYIDKGSFSYFKVKTFTISSTANIRLRFKPDTKDNEIPLVANFTETEHSGVFQQEFERNCPANESRDFTRGFTIYSKVRIYGSVAATIVIEFEYDEIESPPAIKQYQLASLLRQKSVDELKVTYMSDVDDY